MNKSFIIFSFLFLLLVSFATSEVIETPYVYVSNDTSIDDMFDQLQTDGNDWAEILGGFFIVIAVVFIGLATFGSAKVEFGAFGFILFSFIGMLLATILGLLPIYILLIFLVVSVAIILIKSFFNDGASA